MLSKRPSGNLKASSHGHGPRYVSTSLFLSQAELGSWRLHSGGSSSPWPVCQGARHQDPSFTHRSRPSLLEEKRLQTGRNPAPLHTSCSRTSRHGSQRMCPGDVFLAAAGRVAGVSFCVQGAFLWPLFHIKPSLPHSENSGRV